MKKREAKISHVITITKILFMIQNDRVVANWPLEYGAYSLPKPTLPLERTDIV
jgi:hypothetical protein